MPFLIAALILVGALCLLDLVLTMAVIRRLRLHTGQLEMLIQGQVLGEPVPAVGTVVDEFATTTIDGEAVSRAALGERTLVAFLSPGCTPCKEQLPALVEHARQAQVIAVISGHRDEATDVAEELRPVARVVVEEDDGEVMRAFKVRGFPAFCLVDSSGTVMAANVDLAVLRAMAEAARTGGA